MKKLLILLIACLSTAESFAQKTDTITTTSGLKYFFLKKGTGPALTPGWLAIWNYTLTLADGTKVAATADRGVPIAAPYPSNQLIKGTNEALALMHIGDRGVFIMPPSIGYGAKGWSPSIPPNTTLIFNMELIGTAEKSLEMALEDALFEKPRTKDSKPRLQLAVDTYEKLKKQQFKGVYASEDDLNSLGYMLMERFPNEAVLFLKLNVELYPKSWNVYDSLGDGYKATGDNKLAIENYKKSLTLKPDNTNAIEMIQQLSVK